MAIVVIDKYNGTVTNGFVLSTTNIAAGSTFSSTTSTLMSAKLNLWKTGSPTGNATAKLYALDATGAPTGAALATSDPLDVTTLTGSPTLKTLSFSGVNQYALARNTGYLIALEYTNGDASNFVLVSINVNHGPYTHSLYTQGAGGAWAKQLNAAAIFFVLADLPATTYNAGTITEPTLI